MPDTPTPVGELKRKYHLLYVDASMGGDTPNWFLVGRDIEDMSINLNPSVNSFENIIGDTVTRDEGYAPSIGVENYYANTGDPIYEPVLNIAMNRLTGEECKTKYLEVIIDKTEGPYKAWQEDCVLKPQSYGGKTNLNIPYNIHPNGNRVYGSATINNRVPTFTEAA
jgi:hypothetical protein